MAKFSIQERVRWGDVDAAKIIFYGSYIRFFEFAESEMFRSLGFAYGQMFEELDIWLPRRHLECDFLQAAKVDDNLEVSCWVSEMGRTSLRLSFEVRRPPDPALVATAQYVLVAVNRQNFEKVEIPERLRQALQGCRG
jgi:acyl-CoA thioester hydrolase